MSSDLQRLILWLREPARLPLAALFTIAFCIVLYLVAVAAVMEQPSRDLKWMAAVIALGILVVTMLHWRRAEAGWVEKAAVFLALVMAVYFDRQTETFLERTLATQVVVFGLLVISIVIRFRLASDLRFRVTPLDILVIFIAVVVPNLPGSIISAATGGESVSKLIALMYGVETLFAAAAHWWRLPTVAALGFLTVCSLFGAF